MALADDASLVVATARQLRGPTANLANTRALVVEPMLSALGWDVTNLDHVARDWPIDGESSISYALRVRDANALFVETRPVNASVDDDALVEETLEHVSKAEARWCVLTNGLRYRLFKADDAVAKADRLMFELELADIASNGASNAVADLSLLTRESVSEGLLEARGEEFYIDPRIQRALISLCRRPSSAFITAMNEAIGAPSVPVQRLRASLGRAIDLGVRASSASGGGSDAPTHGRPRTSQESVRTAPVEDADTSEPHPAPTGRFTPPATRGRSRGSKTVAEPAVADHGELATATIALETPVATAEEATLEAELATVSDAEAVAEVGTAESIEEAVATELADETEETGATEEIEAVADTDVDGESDTETDAESDEADTEAEAATDVDAASDEADTEAEADAVIDTEADEESDDAGEADLDADAPADVEWAAAAPGRFGRRTEHPLTEHYAGRPAEIVDLFEQLDRYAYGLGEDTTRRVHRNSVEYLRRGENWFSVTLAPEAIRVNLTLLPELFDAWRAEDPEPRSAIAGTPGLLGECEIRLADISNLLAGCELVRVAYEHS